MDRSNIEKIAKTPEEKVLLAKVWDKISTGIRKSIPSNTCFLTRREQEMARYLFGNADGLVFFGGYNDAERQMLVYLPEYMEEDSLLEDGPLVCLRATFYLGDSPTHRDFLGSLMGAGISRESVGDISVSKGSCDFFVTQEIAPYLLQSFTGAGRTRVHLEQIDLKDVIVREPEFKEVRDTLASLRLDSMISAGFRVGRSQAVQYIAAGRVAVDGLSCEKPDKTVEEGCRISVRGLGKIQLKSVNGQTKKGRIAVLIHRYV